MKFKIGDTVDYKNIFSNFEFKSCTVIGYSKSLNYYIIQIPEKYKRGWTTVEDDEKAYGLKAGTKRCWLAYESCLTLSKTSKKSTYNHSQAFKIKHEKLILKKIKKLMKEIV